MLIPWDVILIINEKKKKKTKNNKNRTGMREEFLVVGEGRVPGRVRHNGVAFSLT